VHPRRILIAVSPLKGGGIEMVKIMNLTSHSVSLRSETGEVYEVPPYKILNDAIIDDVSMLNNLTKDHSDEIIMIGRIAYGQNLPGGIFALIAK
jgi:hypothetical protein